jgi:glutamate--cysteine ligase
VTSVDPDGQAVLNELAQAEGHIHAVCFKTGPPRHIGVELEWTLHHAGDTARPLDLNHIQTALGPYAPDSPGPPVLLPGGGRITLEPGGQVEISSAPADDLPALHAATSADISELSDRLAAHGLELGDQGIDPHRPPRRLLTSQRYASMERAFDSHGPSGRTMMGSTAGLQVCVDAGEDASRWTALTMIGPALVAAFATSRWHAGRDTGWASARMKAWLGIDPGRTRPVSLAGDPATTWARYALNASVLAVRRDDGPWDRPPPGLTFAGWIAGGWPRPPTVADLDYHLSTLFPPVRPRGYLEVRYLDTQPGEEWIAPAAVVAALLSTPAVTGQAIALAAETADRWADAARLGLDDPCLRRAAAGLFDLAAGNLDRTGLPAEIRDQVTEITERRLATPAELRSMR